MNKPKLIFLSGSVRKESVNKVIAYTAYEIAKNLGADATFIDLKEYNVPIYDGDLETAQGLPENAKKLKKLFIDSDGIFIASPEYNRSVTPLLKNTIDWISRVENDKEPWLLAYKNKAFALASAAPGQLGGKRSLEHLEQILTSMGAKVLSKTVSINDAYNKVQNAKLISEDAQRQLQHLVEEFIKFTSEHIKHKDK